MAMVTTPGSYSLGGVAEITPLRQGQLLLGVSRILSGAPEGMQARDVLAKLRALVPPTPFEDADYPNRPGVARYEKIVRFSTILMVKAGWLFKSDGIWSLTKDGDAAAQRYADDPKAFRREAGQRYDAWKKGLPQQPPAEVDAADPDAEAARLAVSLEETEEAAANEIIEYVDKMNWLDFQRMVAAVLRASGYHVHRVAGPGVKGVDILATPDALGLQKPRIKVEVKHRADSADINFVRAFMDQLGPDDVGIYVSTGGFTADAEHLALTHDKRLTLLTTQKLVALWKEAYERLEESDRRFLPLKAVYYLDRALP
jgi:restriction system protein